MKIINRLKQVSKVQLVSYSLFALSAVTLFFAVYMNMSVDVLKDWKLIMNQDSAYVGDTVVIESVYHKTMNVTGVSTRYMECKNSDGILIRYAVSEAKANRASGQTGTGIMIVVPSTIPDLPTKCRINIIIDYEIYKFRHVIESQQTKEFTLYPRKDDEVSDAGNKSSGIEDKGSISQNQSIDSTKKKSNTNIITREQTRQLGSQSPLVNSNESVGQEDITLGDETEIKDSTILDGLPLLPNVIDLLISTVKTINPET